MSATAYLIAILLAFSTGAYVGGMFGRRGAEIGDKASAAFMALAVVWLLLQ